MTAEELEAEDFAQMYLPMEREQRGRWHPPGYSATFRWRGEWRIGCVQPLERAPIAIVNVGSHVIPRAYIEALGRHDPGRAIVTVDDQIDLTGQLHILCVDNGRARRMDPEETKWAADHAPNVLMWTNDVPGGKA